MSFLDETGLSYFWNKVKALLKTVAFTGSYNDLTDKPDLSNITAEQEVAYTSSDPTSASVASYANDSIILQFDSEASAVGTPVYTTGDQEITGTKTFTSDISADKSNFIIKNTISGNTGEIGIEGGNGYANGAYLILYGASHANRPGQFRLNTPNGNKRLIGNTDGTLSWDGNIKLINSATTSIIRDNNTGKTWVCGGESASYSDGAHLTVCGVNQATDPGAFFLVAGNSNGAKELAGYPDGTLTWNGLGFVYTNTNQQIEGEKTFGGSLYLKQSLTITRSNPYLWFVETDWEKGTAPSATTYQGIVFRDKEEHDGGAIYYHFYNNKTSEIEFRVNKLNESTDTAWGGIYINYKTNGTTSLYPGQNTWLLGENTSTRKWKEIWCAQSSINSSSDEREKQQIATISDEVLDAWSEIQWSQFKWNKSVKEKGEYARLHTGLIAQRIASVFSAHNLDAASYGLFLHDTWDAEPARTDDKGNIIAEPIPAGDAYGLRYTEALAIEAAYQRRRADRLEARLKVVEDYISQLKENN